MVTYEPKLVPLQKLLLDPNNFRFREPGRDGSIAESRFAEGKVQSAALERIRSDGVTELKRSIAENGFVPVERIVVRAVQTADGPDSESEQYVVIEGNRRTTALKLLEQEHAGGVDFPRTVTETFANVPVLVANDASDDDLMAIMGIRHVGGPKEWGGYQSALLVYQLVEQAKLTPREVASRLGLTVNEVNRRHRAFSALSQMIVDEDYGDRVSPEMYPLFHEAVGQPAVREWLGWSASDREFTHEENRELFYSWLVSDEGSPKIRSYTEIRELKLILDNEDALVALKDDDQSFSDALAVVRADAKAARWLPNVKSALASLNEMGSDTIEALDADSLAILDAIKRKASWIIKANALSSEKDDADEEA
ncbi:ParB N-terminal domain-containing protein [Rhodococcus pyridinivorans]|uniref:ParB N-terminal domain-containing protein n=1 Tax=Rhodococcus pyridinivorans TaxID=103816 RepID=UPI000EB22162|nr:ParB N-terminal domain-containing protein [Rhodococcus pyridinivorans]